MQTEEKASGLCSRAMSKFSYTFCCSMADIRRACRDGRREGPVSGEKTSQRVREPEECRRGHETFAANSKHSLLAAHKHSTTRPCPTATCLPPRPPTCTSGLKGSSSASLWKRRSSSSAARRLSASPRSPACRQACRQGRVARQLRSDAAVWASSAAQASAVLL